MFASIEATLRGLANDPGQLAEPQKSDLYLRLSRELKNTQSAIAQTSHYLNNLALSAMSDEAMRR